MIAAIKRLLTTRRKLQSDTIDSLRRDVIRLHAAKMAAEKRADEAEAARDNWKGFAVEAQSAQFELAAIKRARSAAVSKGNTTRRLKREAAAKVSA